MSLVKHNGKVEDLGFGHLGNGLSVWDRTREENRDYLMVAHIRHDRSIAWREHPLSNEQRAFIERLAKESDPQISHTQEQKVFSSRPTHV